MISYHNYHIVLGRSPGYIITREQVPGLWLQGAAWVAGMAPTWDGDVVLEYSSTYGNLMRVGWEIRSGG